MSDELLRWDWALPIYSWQRKAEVTADLVQQVWIGADCDSATVPCMSQAVAVQKALSSVVEASSHCWYALCSDTDEICLV